MHQSPCQAVPLHFQCPVPYLRGPSLLLFKLWNQTWVNLASPLTQYLLAGYNNFRYVVAFHG